MSEEKGNHSLFGNACDIGLKKQNKICFCQVRKRMFKLTKRERPKGNETKLDHAVNCPNVQLWATEP